jgi:DNA modification methylase
LVADTIVESTPCNGIVLDPLAGGGTAVLAAEQAGRRCYAMEMEYARVDLMVRRFERVTGKQAFDAVSGRSFSEMNNQRCAVGSAPGDVEDEVDER